MNNDFDRKVFQMAEKEQVIMPKVTLQRIEEILDGLSEQKKKRPMNLKKAVLLVAVLSLLASVTVTASVGFYRQRMAEMNQKKLEEFFRQIYESKAPADNYNRNLTKAEHLRKEELRVAYMEQGKFPKGEIMLIERAEDYRGKNVAYLKDTGTFFFPKEEMSEEELLQYIDFLYKRDYSLQKMNELIATGEAEIPEEISSEEEISVTQEEILQSDAIWDPGQELTVPYKGDVSVTAIAAGRSRIYLGGINTVHVMTIGAEESELFYDDFETETQVTFIHEDASGNVYVAGAELEVNEEANAEMPYYLPAHQMALWKLGKDGELLWKRNLSAKVNPKGGFVNELVVDGDGNIYIIGLEANKLHVFDGDGELITGIDTGEFRINSAGGMGIGKDGKVYVTVYEMVENRRRLGIATIDLKKGSLLDIYEGLVPDGTIMLDVITQGAETDFVFWGYDGIFTYNLGDEAAVHVKPAYEIPCTYEAAPVCGLLDGRILIASCNEYVEETYGNGWIRHLRIPEETYFYYLTAVQETKE